tara:strand:+ start:480 stop:1001 length:522 start_codon:yes stop_codon:yes gene_type:complete
MLSFKDMIVVQYRPGEDELTNYRAKRRRNGAMSEKAHTNKEEKITCPECKGEGCDHCDGKGYHVSAEEALNVQQRLARGRLMRRLKSKIAMGRKRAKRRMADKGKLEKRAQRQARAMIAKKLTKDIPKSELSMARRAEIEKRLDRPALKARIQKIAKRIFKDVRKKEIERKKM